MNRTVRLPVAKVDDETWDKLRALAGAAARFGNKALALQYAAMSARLPKEVMKEVNARVYGEDNDILSGWARNAMLRRLKGYWKNKGKRVLAGHERVACFSSDRALSIQCDPCNRGALFERDGDAFVLACRFEPVMLPDGGKREPIRLVIDVDSPGARKDWYIREAVESIWAEAWKPGTATLRFDRRRRKVDVMISYTKPDVPGMAGNGGATLGPYDPESGQVWLRFDDNSRPMEYAHHVRRLLEMSEHFAGIRKRLANRRGRGPRRLQVYRKKLASTPSFAQYADEYTHRWSRKIVDTLVERGVTELRIANLGVGDLPWHSLRHRLAYKCEDAGITVSDTAVEQEATYRATKAKIAKTTKAIARAKKGVRATRDLLDTDHAARVVAAKKKEAAA